MLLPYPDNFQDLNQVAQFIIVISLLELVVTYIIVNILPSNVEDKIYLNSCIIALPKVAVMLYFAGSVILESFSGDMEEQIYHIRDGKPLSYFNMGVFFCLYISHSSCAMFVEIYKDGFGKGTVTMLLHHVISIAAYVICMYTGRFGYLSCLAALCEFTNFPLSVVYITKTKGGGVKEWMENTFGVLLSVNGGMLWLSFIPCRLILFPYVNYKFITLCMELKTTDPTRWSQIWWVEMIGHFTTVSLLFLMSLFWFYKIHSGFMKILNGMKASDAAPEKAE